MTGYRPGLYWQMTWRYIGPAMMSLLLVASVVSMIRNEPEYGAWDPVEVKLFLTISIETFQIDIKNLFIRSRAKLS